MKKIEFTINQIPFSVVENSSDLEMNLLEFLRKEGFTGCKKVCAEGGCGACTVIISRWDEIKQKVLHTTETACLLPLPEVHHCQVTTIEGLGKLNAEGIHPVSQAFYEFGASQCGFCTPGFIVALVTELENNPQLKKAELEHLFDGNLCRCTGYRPIMDAAAVFCQDPLDEIYRKQGEVLRNKLKECQSLDSVFPESFKKAIGELEIEGSESIWQRCEGIENLVNQLKDGGKKSLIAGNTDLAYREKSQPIHKGLRFPLRQIKELKNIEWYDQEIKFGAAVTIDQLNKELSTYLRENKHPPHSNLQALSNQCRFFANNQVRNMATVGGGLINFSTYSDLIPLWVATGAKAIFDKKDVKLDEHYDSKGFLQWTPNDEGVLTHISLPMPSSNEMVLSYKYARRRLDSITFLSAGIRAVVEPETHKLEQIVICFDGLGPTAFRPVKTELALTGKVLDKNLFTQNLSLLEQEVSQAISNHFPERLQKYQVRLALGIFSRFFAQYRETYFKENNLRQTQLVKRYPQVAHRTHIEYDETNEGLLGQAIPHRNSLHQVTGKAKYTEDHEVPNCLYGSLVRSTVASGKINNIDATEALKHPEVVGFYSAKDIPGKNLFGFRVEDEEVLASEEVGYVGQAIGILVAKSARVAKEQARLVKVDITKKPALLDFESAIAAKSFHGRPEGYLVQQGNLDEGFGKCSVTVEGEIKTPPQSQFYLEPQTALVIPKDNGSEVYSSTQSPSNVVDHVADILGVSKNKVEVKVGRLGGGFGGKQLRAGPIAAICALAAHRSGQAVKLSLERHEDLAFCPGRSPIQAKYKAGFDEKGKIQALDMTFYLSGGFTNDYSADITETATLLMDGCYFIPNVKVHGFCLKTNFGSHTSARGFGKPQASAVIESVMDHAAVQLNLDPTTVRHVNLYQKGDTTITKTKIDDNVVWQCWNRLLDKANYSQLKKEVEEFNQNNTWLKRGIAAVSSKGNMGFIESDDINRGISIVQIMRDGTVSVNHSGCEMGQGINTRMAQVAAHHLKVNLDQVEVTDTQSALIPNTPPTTMVASDLIGRAIINACKELNEKLDKFSGSYLEKVEQAYNKGESLSATGIFTAPRLQYDYDKQEGDISYFFVWGSALSVVELDILSGNFRIIKSNIVQDCGKSLNPLIDLGQAEGGFIFGLGLYTMEELIYSDEGKLITDNVSGYKIPSCGDVPLDWDIELLNYKPTGEGLHNSKGIGEANTQLGLSAYFAIKEAMRAARSEAKMDPQFHMNFPASVDRVCEHLPRIEQLLN